MFSPVIADKPAPSTSALYLLPCSRTVSAAVGCPSHKINCPTAVPETRSVTRVSTLSADPYRCYRSRPVKESLQPPVRLTGWQVAIHDHYRDQRNAGYGLSAIHPGHHRYSTGLGYFNFFAFYPARWKGISIYTNSMNCSHQF
jgi:hypothetical protein